MAVGDTTLQLTLTMPQIYNQHITSLSNTSQMFVFLSHFLVFLFVYVYLSFLPSTFHLPISLSHLLFVLPPAVSAEMFETRY